MKCQNCQQYPPIVECQSCFMSFCFGCDDKVHAGHIMDKHIRNTISFRQIHKNLSQSFSSVSFTTQNKTLNTQPSVPTLYSPKSITQYHPSPIQKIKANGGTRYKNALPSEQSLTSSITSMKESQVKQDQQAALDEEIRKENLKFEKEKRQLQQRIEQLQNQPKQVPPELKKINDAIEILRQEYVKGENQVEAKMKEVEKLKDHHNQQLTTHKSELTKLREKYEAQINALEEKLVEASERLEQMALQVEEEGAGDESDPLKDELEDIEQDMKSTAQKIGQQSDEITEQAQKCDHLIDKVHQTTVLQQQQIAKMDEIINIFKLCTEEMDKEKELLLLDNEKLLSEIEIIGKFFQQHAALLGADQDQEQEEQEGADQE